jgi:hypothetical protein
MQGPSAPDPAELTSAQAEANRVNVYSPTGSTTFGTTSDGVFTPGADQASVMVNETDFTRDQRLQQEGIASNLSGLTAGRVQGMPQGPYQLPDQPAFQSDLNLGGLPARGQIPGAANLGDLPGRGQLDTDFGAQRARAEDAVYSRGMRRMSPQIQQGREAMMQQLENSGIPKGSEAWNRASQRYEANVSDSLLDLESQAVGAGRAEQAQGFQQNMGAAALSDQQRRAAMGEQGQMFGQQMAGATMADQQRGTSLGEIMAQTNLTNQGRATGIGETLGARNQNINEITQLLGGSPQFGMPQIMSGQVDALTPALGGYNAQNQQYLGNVGGLSNIFGSALGAYMMRPTG